MAYLKLSQVGCPDGLVEIYVKIDVGVVGFVDVKAKPFVQVLRGVFFVSPYNNPFLFALSDDDIFAYY